MSVKWGFVFTRDSERRGFFSLNRNGELKTFSVTKNSPEHRSLWSLQNGGSFFYTRFRQHIPSLLNRVWKLKHFRSFEVARFRYPDARGREAMRPRRTEISISEIARTRRCATARFRCLGFRHFDVPRLCVCDWRFDSLYFGISGCRCLDVSRFRGVWILGFRDTHASRFDISIFGFLYFGALRLRGSDVSGFRDFGIPGISGFYARDSGRPTHPGLYDSEISRFRIFGGFGISPLRHFDISIFRHFDISIFRYLDILMPSGEGSG